MPASRFQPPPARRRATNRTHWFGRSTVSQGRSPAGSVCRSRADRRLVAAGGGRPASSSCGGDPAQRVQGSWRRAKSPDVINTHRGRDEPEGQTPGWRQPGRDPADGGDPDLIRELGAAHVTYRAKTPPSPIATFILSWVLPLLSDGALVTRGRSLAARTGGGMLGGGIFGVGKSKATEVKPEEVGVTFKDVGGADEAIAELREIIEFLKAPQRFAKLGGRIPKGVPRRAARHRQDAHREGDRRRSRGALLRNERLGVRRDVRRRWRARVRDLFEQARPRRRRSCSSTRSTQSARAAAAASVR